MLKGDWHPLGSGWTTLAAGKGLLHCVDSANGCHLVHLVHLLHLVHLVRSLGKQFYSLHMRFCASDWHAKILVDEYELMSKLLASKHD